MNQKSEIGRGRQSAVKSPSLRPKRISSEILFAENSRVVIEHHGVDYLLQVTRQDKLILTK